MHSYMNECMNDTAQHVRGAFKKFCKSICKTEKLFKIYTPMKCMFLLNTYEPKADMTSL